MKSILDQTPVSALSPWKSLPGDIDPSKVECSFLIFGKSSKTGKYKPLQLHLIGKKIVLTNKQTDYLPIKGCKMIDFDVDICVLVEIQNDDVLYPAGIRIECCGAGKQYFLASKELRDNTISKLAKFCVQTNFESKYLLKEKIGSGNFGKVYEVEHHATKKKFAAKFFVKENFADAEKTVERLLNEIKINRIMNCPYVVQLHEVFESTSQLIFIMDLAYGMNLLEHVKVKPFEEKEAAAIVKKIVEGLHYIHKKDIIHRDLKLENIIYDRAKQEVKIIDFGLSCPASNIGALKKCGTPGYVAPEILRGQDYNHCVDYFSLGVVLYAMLTARAPFGAEDTGKILKKNKEAAVKFAKKHWGSKSYESRDLCFRLLQDNPKKRLRSSQILNHEWFWILLPQDQQLELKSHKSTKRGSKNALNEKLVISSHRSVEPRRVSSEAPKSDLELAKHHSDKASMLNFSNSSKLHKKILKKNLDALMSDRERSKNLSETNEAHTSILSSNDSLRSFIFVKHNLHKAPQQHSMKSFYLKENSIGSELTKLELIVDQKSTTSNNIPMLKTQKSGSSEESIPDDLEPMSFKLINFNLESPTLCTPFSGRMKTVSKDEKNEMLPKDSKSKKQPDVSAILTEKNYVGFSDFVMKIEEKQRLKKMQKPRQRSSLKSLDITGGVVPRRKHSDQPTLSRDSEKSNANSGRSLNSHSSRKKKHPASISNDLNPKQLPEKYRIEATCDTPSFKQWA